MRALAWLVVLSSVAHAEPTLIAPEELRHDLFDQVVIADAKREWGTGAITIVSVPSEHEVRLVMTRAIDPKRVPATLRAWRDRKVIVGLDSSTCASQVTGLRLLAVIDPPSARGFWDGAIDPLPARGEVLATWETGHVWLVGMLAGGCLDRTWVRSANLKVPPVAAPSVVAGQLRDQALAAFRALPAYRTVQARFRGTGEWDAHDGGLSPVERFDLPGHTLLSHAAYIHDGRFDEQLLVIWELRDGARPELKLRQIVTTAALPSVPFGLDFAMDLRGDGHVLFAYSTRDGRGALYETGDKIVDVLSLRLATP